MEATLQPTNLLLPLLAFDSFVLDRKRGVLAVEAREVVLRPKTTAVLAHLLTHAEQVVSRNELMAAVWGDLAVTDDSLTQCISEIRRALGSTGAGLLQTHSRRGYRMATRLRQVAPASVVVAPPAPPAASFTEATINAPAATTPLHSRLGLSALVAAGAGLALALALAIAWLGAVRQPAAPPPALAVPAAGSSWERAEQLVSEGRMAETSIGSVETRMRTSLPLFLRALTIEPRLAEAAAEAAFAYVNLRSIGASTDRDGDLREAERLAAMALAAAPESSRSQSAHAAVLRQHGRFAEALIFYERAGKDPIRVIDRANVGVTRVLMGDAEQARPPLVAALLEEPNHQFAGNWQGYLGLARLMAGQPGEAAENFRDARGSVFTADERMLYRLVALHAAGQLAEAEALNAELRRNNRGISTRLRALTLSEEPAYRARFEAAVLTPLRQLGWTEFNR